MAASLPQDLATQLKYGPTTGSALRRSQYLADALKQLGDQGSRPITGGYGEVAAKLLATAILNRAGKSADRDALRAIGEQRNVETETMLASLRPPPMAPPVMPQIALPPQPAPPALPPPTAALSIAPESPPPAASAAFNAGPDDRDALVRMLATEAGGEGPDGMAAAGHVALNRLKNGYGGAKSLRDVVFAPHQFEGMSRANQVNPDAYAKAEQVADAILTGKVPDPTGGAMAFLNPDLQVKLGRSIPKWASGGDGHRIGNHVFFGGQLGAQSQQTAQAGSPSLSTNGYQVPPPPEPPFDAGAMGAGANPYPPSAPAASPGPAAGTGPAAEPPQAPAAGPTSSPDWPKWKPSQAEVDYVQKLLNDPQHHDAGVSLAMQMQQKMTQPIEATVQMINGVPSYVAKDPTSGAPIKIMAIPQEVLTRAMPAQEAGLPNAPKGLYVQRDPMGNLKEAPGAPPQGYQAGANGALQYQPGGPADPTRPQPAASGYQYAPGGVQAPIQGGPADPRNPMNVIEGTQRFAGQIKTIVDSAMKVKQNFGAVTTGFRQQNGTGDIAMINGLQKLIDEGVVKGEDVNMQMKSNGLEGTLGGWAQYATSKGILPPEVRQKVFKTASDLYQNLDRTYQVRVQSMKGPVEEAYGPGTFGKYVFPDAFAAELGWSGDGKPPPAAPLVDNSGRPQGWSGQLPKPQLETALRFKGATAPGGTQQNPALVTSKEQYEALKPGAWFIDDDGSIVQKGGR